MTNTLEPADTVKEFYDSFLVSRMLGYRLEENLRIKLATELVCRHTKLNGRHLDLGCGIGLVCEALARQQAAATVVGCDLSPQNIWYCRQTIKESNCRFVEGDLLDKHVFERELAGNRFDSISMVDVLEHIPLSEHERLFRDMIHIGTSELTIILTFPSTGYQERLRTMEPEGLQPVDESISLSHLVRLCESLGLTIVEYRLLDVWLSHQYVHCVIKRKVSVDELPKKIASLPVRIVQRFKRSFFARVLVPWRKRKYITRVFADRADSEKPL